jgi:hypothetical protein
LSHFQLPTQSRRSPIPSATLRPLAVSLHFRSSPLFTPDNTAHSPNLAPIAPIALYVRPRTNLPPSHDSAGQHFYLFSLSPLSLSFLSFARFDSPFPIAKLFPFHFALVCRQIVAISTETKKERQRCRGRLTQSSGSMTTLFLP